MWSWGHGALHNSASLSDFRVIDWWGRCHICTENWLPECIMRPLTVGKGLLYSDASRRFYFTPISLLRFPLFKYELGCTRYYKISYMLLQAYSIITLVLIWFVRRCLDTEQDDVAVRSGRIWRRSNLYWDTDCSDECLRGFSQSLQEIPQ
jgi:hypothetical protein